MKDLKRDGIFADGKTLVVTGKLREADRCYELHWAVSVARMCTLCAYLVLSIDRDIMHACGRHIDSII